jgi:predicted lipoprotein with Yx(FWY)xxD motif
MKTSTLAWIVLVLLVVLGGVYWWSHSTSYNSAQMPVQQEETASTSSSGTSYAPGNLLLGTDATTTLGTYLIGSNGMTLYKYAPDKPGVSNCTGQCAVKWPPYTVASADALSNVQAGITGKVGTITRADGTLQVTYNDQPLYFWVNDKVPGDTTGQNVGGVWFVVAP